MTFVDTNYFLRFLLDDNHQQNEKVKELFVAAAEGREQLCSSTIVIFEIYWVLSSYYQQDKAEIISTLEKILALEFIEMDDRSTFSQALSFFCEQSISLEDCYHLAFAQSKKVKDFATFDQKLSKVWQKIRNADISPD
jgi:predicted nucleic acid-binding protein